MSNELQKTIPLASLTQALLCKHRVWRFVYRSGEVLVTPVVKRPVRKLEGKLFGVHFMLANGARMPGFVAGLDEDYLALHQHIATFSFVFGDRWFNLSRYHDADYETKGPAALAEFLRLRVDEVFPFACEVRDLVGDHHGDGSEFAWVVESDPQPRISREDLIKLIVETGAAALRARESRSKP